MELEEAKKAYELGIRYEKEFTGCSQTVIAAMFDALGIWNEDVFKAGSGLADGLGLTGDGSCGALVGASMVISYLFPRERRDFADILKPMKAYALVKQLHDRFLAEYGSCRCQEVQKKLMGRSFNLWDREEMKEAIAFGMIEHCSKVVGNTAKMAVEIILKNKKD